MKKIITLLLGFYAGSAIACSGFQKPFCYVHADKPADAVISGVITAVNGHSLQLSVIDVLHGSESRSVVTIWDGKDYDCNGNVPMNVSLMGSVGDTILAILPLITTTVNTWDVVGDYSRPIHLFTESVLKISADTVRGIINGSPTLNPPYWSLTKIRYSEFKAYWLQHQSDCRQLVALNEESKNGIARLFRSDNVLIVQPSGQSPVMLTIASVTGAILKELRVEHATSIDMQNFPHGMYLVRIIDNAGSAFTQKVLK